MGRSKISHGGWQGDGSVHLIVRATLPRWVVAQAGAPVEVWLDIQSAADSDDLAYDVIWVNKTATRLPEVQLCSSGFTPSAAAERNCCF